MGHLRDFSFIGGNVQIRDKAWFLEQIRINLLEYGHDVAGLDHEQLLTYARSVLIPEILDQAARWFGLEKEICA